MKWKGKISFDARPQYSSEGLITESEINTISGSLQNNIDEKSDIGHVHDDRYYTETEIDGLITTISGKLDDHNELNNLDYASAGHTGFQPAGDYLTDTEFSTYSGTLQTQIDGKSDSGHAHGDLYYTETELNNGQLDTRYYTETEVDNLITAVSGTTDHSVLDNLDYASSGHTGFQPSGNYATDSELTTLSGALKNDIDGKADTSHLHDDQYYTETELDAGQLDNRYYTESEIDTISGSLQTNIDGKSDSSHLHDDRYYTETEVDTISGSLQTNIDGKSDTGHTHDDRYYTEIELDAGQLDNRYYIESEIDTISGSLNTKIDGKSDTSHLHDDRYYTETEVDSLITTFSGTIDHNTINNTHNLTTDIDHNQITNYQIGEHRVINDSSSGSTNLWSAEKIENRVVTATGTLTQDHSGLDNLDYASSGHTGFQPAGDYLTDSEFSTYSGTLQTQIDGKSDTSHLHDDRYYLESEVDTISGSLNTAKSDVGHSHTESDISDLDKYTQAEVDVLITTVSGKLDDHNELNNLDYASAGHTGFQSAGDYATDSELTTLSGALKNDINGKSDLDHIHDDRYYTETELNNGQLDTRYYTETEVNSLITTVSGKLDDHNEMNNLDYASSGHTGFAPTSHTHTESDITDLDKYTEVEVDTISGSLNTKINGKSDTNHIHDDRYYTESEVDTISGTLQTNINGKSDTGHNHDDRYYTETELNEGQLDTRYYTETEVNTISGSLNTKIDGKSDTGHSHTESDISDLDKYTQSEVNTISGSLSDEIDSDISTHASNADAHHSESHTVASHSDTTATGANLNELVGSGDTTLHKHDTLYYTESEVDTISGSLNTKIDGKSDIDHIHDDRYYTETELNNGQLDTRYYTESEVDSLITTISGKLDDHNELNNLDYASSGHTGFQPAGNYATDAELTSTSGILQTNIDGKDNYSSWSFAVDGVTKDSITSDDVLDFVGGDNITIIRSAEDQITISGSAGGGGLSWEVISTDTNAVNGSGYLINAGGGNITLTLPTSPSEGDIIGACDIYEKATTNVITIARNGSNIEGAAEDLTIDVDGSGFTLVYADATRGWEIVSEIGGSENSISDTAYGSGWNGVTDIAPSKNSIYDEIETKADKGTNSDITSTTALTQITRATGGAFDIAIGGAAGDDFTVDTDKLVVEGDSGNVGIGTMSPSETLTLLVPAAPELGFYTTNSDVNARNWAIRTNDYVWGDFSLRQSNAKGGDALSAGTNKFYVKNDGNVGIGTTAPGNPLAVNRSADGIIVDFESADVVEGNVSIAGNTTSYNAFVGSHYTQLKTGQKELPIGAVVISTGEIISCEVNIEEEVKEEIEVLVKDAFEDVEVEESGEQIDEEFDKYEFKNEKVIEIKKPIYKKIKKTKRQLKANHSLDSKTGKIIKTVTTKQNVSPDVSNKEYFTYIDTTNKASDKAVYGVWFGKMSDDSKGAAFGQDNKPVYLIAQVGLFKILVTEDGGNIEIGDYLETSTIPMLAQKQNSSVKNNSTVAKALVNVDFSKIEVNLEFGCKAKLIPCIF